MIRAAIDLLAIGAFIVTIAIWSGAACEGHKPTCKAGSIAALLTNCEVEQ